MLLLIYQQNSWNFSIADDNKGPNRPNSLITSKVKVKVKQSHYRPGQPLRIPGGSDSQISRQAAHEGGNVVSPKHRPPLPPGNIFGAHFFQRLSQPQGYSAAGRIRSMKNSSNTVGNRTRDLVACSAVPQPTAPPAACLVTKKCFV